MRKKSKKKTAEKKPVAIVWKKVRQPETEQEMNEFDRLAYSHFADMMGKVI